MTDKYDKKQASKDQGFIEEDQRGFWVMLLLSLCLHLFFFLYVEMLPLPSKKSTLDDIPDRLVKLVIKPSSLTGIQQNLKEPTKVTKKTTKKSKPLKKTAKAKAHQKKTISKSKKVKPASHKPEKISAKKETTRVIKSAKLANKRANNQESKKASPVASMETAQKARGKNVPAKKKIDLKSIGILGMISSEKSSPPSGLDPQLDLLAKNAANGGETLIKQVKKGSIAEAIMIKEPNNTLEPESKEVKETKKSTKMTKLKLAKKINKLVARHQQTDTVELPNKGDIALQKIIEIKTTGKENPSRTPKAILEVVSSYKSSIIYCYNKALKSSPLLEGRLVVKFSITAEGKVCEAKILSSTFDKADADLGQCVISMVKTWRFAPIHGGVTTVVYPFVFFPAL